LSACAFGRRGRNLDRAIEQIYECAAAEGYRHEKLGPNRYRVRVCYDRTAQRYRHGAVFHCSYKRCASLTERAAQYFAAASGCAIDAIDARETIDPAIFHVLGCNAQATLACEMRDNEVTCSPVHAIGVTPISPAPAAAPPAPATSGGEASQTPDAGAVP
jgi:hypothetical protein